MTSKISYVTRMTGKRVYHEITHDELDAYDFPTPLFEVIKDDEYVHLYFDFDFKTADDVDFDDLYDRFTELEGTFGTFVVAGYCTDKTVHDRFNSYFKRHITLKDADFDKAVSMHVYYPEKRIARDELHTIMNSKHSLSEFIDTSVYKRRGKEQLFRHPYADKEEGDGKGCEIEEDASYLTVTCTGKEPIVTRDEWIKEFPLTLPRAPTFELPPHAPTAESDLTFEVFEALYKGFDGLEIHGDVQNCDKEITLYPLLSALFASTNDVISDDAVWDAIDHIRAHAKLTPNAVLKWDRILTAASKNTSCTGPGALFKYIKTFNADYYEANVRPLLQQTQHNEPEFDLKDDFVINDIRAKGAAGGYQRGDELDYEAVLNDLRRVMIVVDKAEALYVFKERDAINDRMTTNCYRLKTAKDMLKQLKVGTELKDDKKRTKVMRSAWDVYDASANNAAFYKRAIKFYSDNDKDFSFFQGYKYEPVQNDALIEGFINHVRHIWCSDNEELFTYVQAWFATALQKPLGRAKTALVVKGAEGTGKNTVTDAWSELLAGYATPNVSNIDTIVGRFNSSVENKKLLVCNEMTSAEMKSSNVWDRLKALITENYVDIEVKGIDVRKCENVANFVFLSNNFNPVKITEGDRRYCVLTPSEAVKGDRKYFRSLYASMKDVDDNYRKDFMQALMHYYVNFDTSVVDLKDIPETEEREMLQESNKGAIESFIEEYCVELSGEGLSVATAFDQFKTFVTDNGFKYQCKKTTFNAEMSKYCRTNKNGKYVQAVKNKSGVRAWRFTDEMSALYAELISMKMEAIDAE